MTEANKKFYGLFFTIVVPIALQQLISSALSVADTLMLGYVSQTALASSSLAGQIQFVLNMIFMGLAAGITILTAQYWGKGNLSAVEKVFSIGLKLSFIAGAVFFVGAVFFRKRSCTFTQMTPTWSRRARNICALSAGRILP